MGLHAPEIARDLDGRCSITLGGCEFGQPGSPAAPLPGSVDPDAESTSVALIDLDLLVPPPGTRAKYSRRDLRAQPALLLAPGAR
jgi:hypothetical protein